MQGNEMSVTTDEVRQQLALSESSLLSSEADRLRYAMGTALVGTIVGSYMVFARDLGSTVPRLAISGVFLGAAVGTQYWFERSAGSIPRHAKRWFGVSFVVSMLIALGAVLPILNLRTQTEPSSAVALATAVMAIALPSWVAAWAIARSPTRAEP